MDRVYFDYATTTPVDPSVERAMRLFSRAQFGNAGSVHQEGVMAARALSAARTSVARLLEAHAEEITFTSGGTEANNIAMMGSVRALEKQGASLKGLHIIASEIEHSSVRNCARALREQGVRVSFVGVNSDGIVRLEELERSIRAETVLVSVMYANNEIGTVQPIRKIAALVRSVNARKRARRIIFHTDACQASLYLPISQDHLGADVITLDGHKMYGPKGVGVLYTRRGVSLAPLLYGGDQERGLRPGTEAVPLAVGFTKALSLATSRRVREGKRIATLRDYFFERLTRLAPEIVVNGSRLMRLPNNVNISIPGLDAEFAMITLDALGVACSTKSACLKGERESYVVKALGRRDGSERSSLRFTLGGASTKRDVDHALRALKEVLHRQSLLPVTETSGSLQKIRNNSRT